MTPAMTRRYRLTVTTTGRVYLKRWSRSRDPIAVLVFAGVLCFYDYSTANGPAPGPWWGIVVFLAAWSGFLSGYDSYERLRSDGSLRLILLRGAPRPAIALGFAAAAATTALLSVTLAVSFLFLSGRAAVSADTLLILAAGGVACVATVAYAQCMSLVLPKDTAAVLGVIALIFGASVFDRWLPSGTPDIVRSIVHVVWSSIPNTYRLSQFAAGEARPWNLAVLLTQACAGIGGCAVLLGKRVLLARARQEG